MLYTVKCFWPGVTEERLRLAARRARASSRSSETRFRGAIYLPDDQLVLGLFDAASRQDAKRASERAGMPCERVMETVWVEIDP